MVVVVVWGDEEEGEAWVLWKRFLIIKKQKQKKNRRAFNSFYFNIYINRSFFHPRYFIVFFLPLRSIFPVNISLFVCFCVFFLRIIHRTPSHWMWRTGWTSQYQLSLSYWKRWWWDLPRLKATLPSCEGLDRPLRGTSYRLVLLLGVGAWRRKETRRGGEREKMREMAIRPENVPLPLLLLQNRGSNSPFFPPAGPRHACVLLSNSQLSGDKTHHYLDYQMLDEMY